jgi:hypothetical protein
MRMRTLHKELAAWLPFCVFIGAAFLVASLLSRATGPSSPTLARGGASGAMAARPLATTETAGRLRIKAVFVYPDGRRVVFRAPTEGGTITREMLYRRLVGKYGPDVNETEPGSGQATDNPDKVILTNEKDSLLGSMEYTLTTWTKWHWDPYCPGCDVKVLDTGRTVDTGDSWCSDGVIDLTKNYFIWTSGIPATGFKHYETVQFQDTCLGGTGTYTGRRVSTNKITSHSDGSWSWLVDSD